MVADVQGRRALMKEWRSAALHAVAVSLLVLSLFTYWFGVADRYSIFLYGHLGATPFDEVTTSRYWMSGLVASGAVAVLYTAANWLLGRLAARRGRNYQPPAWWRVWGPCAVALAPGILAITMTVNEPTLPLLLAGACAAVSWSSLALALMPARWAARRPLDLAWLAADGAGLVPSLVLLRALELPGRGLAVRPAVAILAAAGGTVAGATWLGLVTALRAWRRRPTPGAAALFASGLTWAYLVFPLVHHLTTPAQYRYISASSNLFAFHWGLQVSAWAVAAALALGITWLRLGLTGTHKRVLSGV